MTHSSRSTALKAMLALVVLGGLFLSWRSRGGSLTARTTQDQEQALRPGVAQRQWPVAERATNNMRSMKGAAVGDDSSDGEGIICPSVCLMRLPRPLRALNQDTFIVVKGSSL